MNYMKHKIALLADIHGNASALKAVIEDSIKEGVTEYWLLGDLIMPGPGANDLFEILDSIKVSYDVEKELKNAISNKLPYIDLYREMLETGKTHHHDIELLQKLNDKFNYKNEIINFFEKNYWEFKGIK